MSTVDVSTKVSFSIQIAAFIAGVHGLHLANIESNKEENNENVQQVFVVLFDLLALELFFQIVESVTYVFFIVFKVPVQDMAVTRYYDWILSTPAMLVSFAYYFAYLNGYRKRLSDFVKENWKQLLLIIFTNSIMLLTGFFSERYKLQCERKMIFQSIGFFALIATFTLLFQFVKGNKFAKQLFVVFFVIWFFYGIAFSLDVSSKNIMYNILDLFSKNFFGIFVYFNILLKIYPNMFRKFPKKNI